MGRKNDYLDRQRTRDRVLQDATRQTFQQYMTDTLILTLNDSDVMGERCLRVRSAEESPGRLGQVLRLLLRRADEGAGRRLRQGEDGPRDEAHHRRPR